MNSIIRTLGLLRVSLGFLRATQGFWRVTRDPQRVTWCPKTLEAPQTMTWGLQRVTRALLRVI